MADYIFLNPSPNLYRVADYVRGAGHKIKVLKNSQLPEMSSGAVHMFYGGGYKTIKSSDATQGAVSDYYTKVKKTIFSHFAQKKITGELKNLHADLSGGNLVDLSILKHGNIDCSSKNLEADTGQTLRSLISDYPESKIITGCMEHLAGDEKMNLYDTDFDLKEALGGDLCVFFADGARLEVCAQGNRLITVGDKKMDHLAFMKNLQPFMKKFAFTRVK